LAGPTVVPGPYPDRTLSAHICRVPPPSMTTLCSSNLIAGCREPDWAAPAFTGSGRRRFSIPRAQISTQSAEKRSRNLICPGHSGQLERSARMRYQPSKLVMRVRFPSPAPVCWLFLILCSRMSAIQVFCRTVSLPMRCISSSIAILELNYVDVGWWDYPPFYPKCHQP
jgi:hypothetical protein